MFHRITNYVCVALCIGLSAIYMHDSVRMDEIIHHYENEIDNLQTQINKQNDTINNTNNNNQILNIDSAVKIEVSNRSGSGTIIYSKKYDPEKDMSKYIIGTHPAIKEHKMYQSFILTAFHLFSDYVFAVKYGGFTPPMNVIMDRDNKIEMETIGYLVYACELMSNDCAIVMIESDVLLPFAEVSSIQEANDIELYSSIYYIGYPLGRGPCITEGPLFTKGLYDAPYVWGSNAMATFGNSGGGVFCSKTNKFIGVVTSIDGVNDGNINVHVMHLSYFNPIENIQSYIRNTSNYLLFMFKNNKE